jgi:hypothetical protein
MNKLLLSFALATAGTAVPCLAAIVIADPTMGAGSYSGATVAGSSGGGVSASSTSPGSGGNTGPHRSTAISFGAGSFGLAQYVGELNTLNTWNPATQGAITTVAFAIDQQVSDLLPFPQQNLQLTFGLRQGGITYYGGGWAPFYNTSWSSTSTTLLNATNFGPVGSRPDFSASGGVIEFGYFVGAFAAPGGVSATLNVDNFCVAVNEGLGGCAAALAGTGGGADLPEPASIAMMGSALVALGVLRRFKQ